MTGLARLLRAVADRLDPPRRERDLLSVATPVTAGWPGQTANVTIRCSRCGQDISGLGFLHACRLPSPAGG